jgi:hypothetical protein
MKIGNRKLSMVAAAAILMIPAAAHAADRGFCRAYTDDALRQAREVRESPFCARAVDYDPARWSFDGRGHYEWCLTMPPQAAEAERYGRSRYLHECHRR